MPRLYGGDVTITSTLRGSNRLSTSTQSPRWKCADFPGPVGTVLYGFRRTDTLLFLRISAKPIGVRVREDTATGLRGLRGQRRDAEPRRRHPFGRDRVVASMAVAAAALALLFHVAELAAGRHFAIASHHASTAKCREPQESNETHCDLHLTAEQYVCRAFGANAYAPLLSRCVYRLQRRHARERTRSDLWTEKRRRGFDGAHRARVATLRAYSQRPSV